jgi:hypothetical protein
VPAVNFDFLDRRSAERFAELLDETTGGRRHHVRGQADEQLAELVAIGHSLSGARSGVQVEPEFRVGLRAMLVATAERDGVGRTAVPETQAGDSVAGRAGRAGRLFGTGSGRRIRARGAIVIGVAAGAMAVSGISAASENAAPGDALYGVKRSTERAQLAMAGSDLTRGQLSLDFARNRLAEATALPGDNPRFGDVLDDMDDDTRQGVRLLTGSAVARRDKTPLNTIDTFDTGQLARLSPVLGKLSPDNRERAVASMNLLDDVHQRTEDLRAGLACGTVSPSGADVLGPKLRGCMAGSAASGTPQRQQGTSEQQGKSGGSSAGGTSNAAPDQTGSAADPGATGKTKKPADDTNTIAPYLAPATGGATPAQSNAPADPDPGDSDSGSGLGGLLGSIFGGN